MKQKLGPGVIIGFIVILIWCLLPVAWIISLSFKPVAETTSGSPQFLPKTWTIQNYKDIFNNDDFLRALGNSFGIALIATFLAVAFATLAAYAIARLEFKGKRVVLSIALAIAMFPVVSLVGPLFDMWRGLGLFDTWFGLIIPYMTFTLPMAIWTLSAFFREIPWDLDKAARVDGANAWQLLVRVKLPLIRPVMQLVLVLVTINAVQLFDLIFVMTQGGPNGSTQTIVSEIYSNAFQYSRMGYASAMALALFVLLTVVSAFNMFVVNRRRGGNE